MFCKNTNSNVWQPLSQACSNFSNDSMSVSKSDISDDTNQPELEVVSPKTIATIPCEKCEKKFASKSGLQRHLKNAHGNRSQYL